MTQAEKIDELIEMGFSYQEVLEKSESKAAYVKGRFTKAGLDWKAMSLNVTPEVAEAPEEVEEAPIEVAEVPEKREEGSDQEDETIETVGTEDETEISGDLVELPVPDEPQEKDEEETLYDRALAYKDSLNSLPMVRRARTGKYIEMVLAILENGDYSSQIQSSMNCRYMMIAPRPTRMNFYKEIFNIQNEMKELFRNSRK
jgi:hypothetical protein